MGTTTHSHLHGIDLQRLVEGDELLNGVSEGGFDVLLARTSSVGDRDAIKGSYTRGRRKQEEEWRGKSEDEL